MLQSIIVLLTTGLIAFSMFRFVGDPVDNMLGQERTDADIDRLRDQLGLNDPFFIQYWNFLTDAMQGNLGISFRQGRSVTEVLIERLPATLELAFVSALFAILLGVTLGVFTAIKTKGWISNFILSISLNFENL